MRGLTSCSDVGVANTSKDVFEESSLSYENIAITSSIITCTKMVITDFFFFFC